MRGARAGRLVVAPGDLHHAALAVHVPGPCERRAIRRARRSSDSVSCPSASPPSASAPSLEGRTRRSRFDSPCLFLRGGVRPVRRVTGRPAYFGPANMASTRCCISSGGTSSLWVPPTTDARRGPRAARTGRRRTGPSPGCARWRAGSWISAWPTRPCIAFDSNDSPSATLARWIEAMLATAYNYRASVTVRTRNQLRSIVELNPSEGASSSHRAPSPRVTTTRPSPPQRPAGGIRGPVPRACYDGPPRSSGGVPMLREDNVIVAIARAGLA